MKASNDKYNEIQAEQQGEGTEDLHKILQNEHAFGGKQGKYSNYSVAGVELTVRAATKH